MKDAFLLSRVLLKFQSADEDLRRQLSAIAITPDGSIWVGSDEFLTVERLSPLGNGIYGDHKKFHVKDFFELAGDDSEIDIEGMDYADGYLWLVGSHSSKRKKAKGKKPKKDIQRLAEISQDANRYLLARIPVIQGELVKSVQHTDAEAHELNAAALQRTTDHNLLLEALEADEHLGPFLKVGLPSKENGLDIEGLAVCGHRVFLGLRGPVLRGWAIILEIELEDCGAGELALKDLGKGCLYRKHFVDLNGLGIRELCLYQDDLLILAGPTMLLPGTMRVFKLESALDHSKDTIWDQDSGALTQLFDLPYNPDYDNAEGLALYPCLGYDDGLLVVYDSPDPQRCPNPYSIFADIFRLPAKVKED